MADAVVTGASGFIGSRLRDRLLERGLDVVAFRRPASPPARRGRSIEVDYGDPDSVRKGLQTAEAPVIFHVAGATKGVRWADFRRANVDPTRALVNGLVTSGARPRFVLVSSLAAFGPSKPEAPHGEGSRAAPVEHYGRSKLEAEQVVANSGLPYTILRPGGVYGPADVDYFKLFELADRGWNLFFGNRLRSFSKIYVDDAVDAIVAASRAEATAFRDYFLCDGAPVTFEAFQAEISRQAGRRVRELDLPGFLSTWAALGGELLSRLDGKPRLFNRQKAIMGAQDAWTCDPSTLWRDLKMQPRFNLEAGVAEAYRWYRSEGWLPSNSKHALPPDASSSRERNPS
jgi:nucleoside-diphosphate-sugar epimerase